MKDTATSIVQIIQAHGYQAYFAGGCVRDMLMKKQPTDYDIVTSATPEQIQKIIPKTYDVGKKFGVIIATIGKYNFEIATFRGESEYKDARHPEKVFFTNAYNDAKRRDFTINGIFYDPIARKMIDYVNGENDIKEKIIRFIGNSNDRIKEDHLRLLRAIRFKNTLNFVYDKRTWEAVCVNSYRIESVSNERIAYELNRMFNSSSRANALLDLSDSGILKYVLPEVEKTKGVPQPQEFHQEGDVFTHIVLALRSLPEDAPLYLVWATIFHDLGKVATLTMPKNDNDRIRFNKHAYYSAGIAAKICRRLRMPNIERETIVWLVKHHMMVGDIKKMNLAKRRRFMLDPKTKWLLELHKADATGIIPNDLSMYNELVNYYNDAQQFLDENSDNEFKPLITGTEVMNILNINESPKVGKILEFVEEAQLLKKIKTKGDALKYVKNNFSH